MKNTNCDEEPVWCLILLYGTTAPLDQLDCEIALVRDLGMMTANTMQLSSKSPPFTFATDSFTSVHNQGPPIIVFAVVSFTPIW